jgi:hypothetical protein
VLESQESYTMSYRIDTFSSLLKSYPTWNELYRYLVSPEGGSLRIVERAGFAVIRYAKGKSDMSKEHVRQFRSVVWNMQTHRPVCVAPVKAEKSGDKAPADADVLYSEFMDGSMINVYADTSVKNGYQIASRTQITANSSFYTKTTFADMFTQAVKQANVFFDLEEGEFISCVVQHPENRIVVPVRKSHIWITQYGRINADGVVTVFTDAAAWPEKFMIYAPARYSLAEVKKLKDTYEQKGYVIQERDGSRRWRYLHDEYEAVRALRGAEADSLERFLRLRRDGKVKMYLNYYREESQEFWGYEKLLRERTQQLGEFYVRVKKLKEVGMRGIPFEFRQHVYALHGQYLASLPTPKSIDKAAVIEYANNLDLEKQVRLVRASLFIQDEEEVAA